jgi:hypothetical protein
MCIVDFVLKFPNLRKTSISYDTHLKNLKLYKNRCGFTLSLYFGHIDLCCSWTMSLRVLEGPTYTVCMRRASLTLSLSNQTSISSHVLTQLLPRALFEVTTIQSYLDFYVQSNTLPTLMPIQSGFIFRILYHYSCNLSASSDCQGFTPNV